MKTSVKMFMLTVIISALSLQLFSQQTLRNSERVKIESTRKLIDSLKIHQLIAYKYDYVGGKKSEEKVIAESRNYNSKGYIKSEYSTIDNELSYIWARNCKQNIETVGGLSRTNTVGQDLYSLPSVIRHYTYSNDTLKEIIEGYPIENDTVLTSIIFSYSTSFGFKSVKEDAFSTSKNWMVCKSRDLYMNSYISLGDCGPWAFKYDATYYFNINNSVSAINGNLTTTPFRKQFVYNRAGQIEKIVGYYNNSFKIISKHLFEYDAQGNVIFADIEDSPGHVQIKKKYDQNNNMIEFEQNVAEKYPNLPKLVEARYRHSFYKYHTNGLLKERIDVGKAMDTLCTISYVYRYDNDNREAISDLVNAKLKEWKTKGKYESTLEHNNRISEANIKIQSEIFKKDVIDFLGQERYSIVPIKMEYNADTECFKLIFEELAPLYLRVPRNEAEEFEKNIGKYTIYPHFEEGKDGLILKSCIVKYPELSKEYKSITL